MEVGGICCALEHYTSANSLWDGVTLHMGEADEKMLRGKGAKKCYQQIFDNYNGNKWTMKNTAIMPTIRKTKNENKTDNYIKVDWSLSYVGKYAILPFCVIADICHHRHHRQWGTFFKPMPFFLHRKRRILANLGYLVANLRTFGVLSTFTGLDNAVVPTKLTNIRHALCLLKNFKRLSS